VRCVVCGKVAKSKADGSKGGPKWEGPLCSAHLEKLRRNGDPRISKKAGPPKGVPFKRVGGEGSGRPSFGQALTPEAEKFNAPRRFGKSLDSAASGDDSEILPISKPKLRRAKARRNKA